MVIDIRKNRIGAHYTPLAGITLLRAMPIDDSTLHFDPFRTGRGIHPVGFVHHLRIAAYAASQLARDVRQGRSPMQPRLVT